MAVWKACLLTLTSIIVAFVHTQVDNMGAPTMVEKMGAPDGSKQVVNSQRKDPANHPQPVCDTYKAK
eukprot:1145112-Pelagomonas_calceolata.AAC.11